MGFVKIIAVDFDGCLCENSWPEIGDDNPDVIRALLEEQRSGAKIILWTCREGERLREAVEWCKGYGLRFDAVNSNIPEMIEWYGKDTRKIGYDVLIDDKAVNKPKYHVPYKEKRNV